MGIPTSVSIGSMVNLPPTARSEDYVGACNCKYLSREKPRNRYIFARGAWGDVCASRRGVVFLLYLAFIDRVKDPVPRNHYIFARGAWGDVCASKRGVVFLLYLVFIDRASAHTRKHTYTHTHTHIHIRTCPMYTLATKTLHSARHPLHDTLCTSLPTCHLPHVTLCTPISAHHSLQIGLCTSLSACRPLHVTLCTSLPASHSMYTHPHMLRDLHWFLWMQTIHVWCWLRC